ncbi:MAG: transglycosylase SLT domain-containing protein [Candidatus Gastranaerophilales bacterium]|nr:transglycosylase SLT domain-containing protein [Candidatus Gastranaerophilales bacterium]
MISKQKILLIAIIVLIILVGSLNLFPRFVPEQKNYKIYGKALNKYQTGSFSDAYDTFGKVSKFSKLKPAAIYRQALCAEKSGDNKTKIKKYNEIIRNYSNSTLGIRAKYLKAQYLYGNKKYKKAKKEFLWLLNKTPQTDYGIASNYYLGLIEVQHSKSIKNQKKKLKSETKAVKYFKNYLKASPKGRFAVNCIEEWTTLNRKLNNEDNLVIAKIYIANGKHKEASKYLKYTNISLSWPYFVQNTYAMRDYSKTKYYTVLGLKDNTAEEILINEDFDEKEETKNIYDAIDTYLKLNSSPKESIQYLLSIAEKSGGYDYLLFKTCNNLPENRQTACYNTLFYKYPNGQFSADALANIFYDKIKSQNYFAAQKLGKKHLLKYKDAKSTPKVMFWMAKIAQRTKNYEDARSYYKNVIEKFPDDYYAYHAFLNLNTLRRFSVIELTQKPIEFPYKNYDYGLVTELAQVKDYGLINQLYNDDLFIRSWLAYLQGDFSNSARVARDAMEKLSFKPSRSDPRWRLVYPIHYYDDINIRSKTWHNDPVLILSIIREESYFNPKAQSHAGASGLMQLMPSAANEAGAIIGIKVPNRNMLLDPDINIRLGNIYYSQLRKRLSGKDILTVMAYNGGIGSVLKWKDNLNYLDTDDFVEQIPYPETQNYLKKVYRSYWNYLRIYDGIRF